VHFPALANRTGGIDKLWPQLEALKRKGLARSIGVSNYQRDQLAELLSIAEIKPAVNQIRHHAYSAQDNKPVIELATEHGIVTAAYSSLTPITQMPGLSIPLS
jgi:diketogulonate reductase-like aldo/keto reductase